MLHRGRAFGNSARRSAEGIVVPIFEKSGKRSHVCGLLSVLSYTPDCYSETSVWEIECLAESLGTALRREREDEARRNHRFSTAPKAQSAINVEADPGRLLEDAGARLKRIRQMVEDLQALIPTSTLPCDRNLVYAAERLAQECERSQTETLEMLLRAAVPDENPFLRLTAREREVGALLAREQTNRQIAQRLFISEKTAKTHVGNIIQKLAAGGRSGVAQILKPHVASVYANDVESHPSSE
jgi:DNA-binding CsgD family transcriptional regulator